MILIAIIKIMYRSAYFHITLRNILISVNYFAVDFMRSETVMLCTNFVLLHRDVSQLQLKQDVCFATICTSDYLSFPKCHRQ